MLKLGARGWILDAGKQGNSSDIQYQKFIIQNQVSSVMPAKAGISD